MGSFGGLANRSYYRTLAQNAIAAIGWLQSHGVEFTIPVYYLSVGPPRIQPRGGGRAIVARLAQAARQAGLKVGYECSATRLVMVNGKVSGIEIRTGEDVAKVHDADPLCSPPADFRATLI
jgi:tricarballylate dehydrogenase